MTYNSNTVSNTLYPRPLYALYIGPNNNETGHLIFKLSTIQKLTTMKYQTVPVPENLFETINETDLFTIKIQINHSDGNRFTAQNNHFDNTKDDGQAQSNDVDKSEDESYDELNSSRQIDCIKSNTMFHQENQFLLTVG